MNLAQMILMEKISSTESNQVKMEDNLLEPFILYASQTESAGNRGEKSGNKEEIDAPQASDNKREKDTTGKTQEDIVNQAKDQKEDASITEPDTNLTGDTGNLDIGQTDLGASGTGAEDL